MCRDAILPTIAEEIAGLGRSIFHLDGPGALRHLDDVLALTDLDALPWVYGAGHEPAGRWIDVYERAQVTGKAVEVSAVDLADARTIMDHLDPHGVWLNVGGSYTPAEADAILDEVTRWAAGKR